MTEKLIVVILLVFIALALLLMAYTFWKLRFASGVNQKDARVFQLRWLEIEDKFAVDLNHAVLDADKLLDLALTKKGYQGTVAEKLKKSAKLFSRIDDVWSAHKLRNRVAHEIGFQVSTQEGRAAFLAFQRALRDLGYLK
jgi:flagellar basal body-associated protein FliL